MIVYHATLRKNLASIKRRGLLTRYHRLKTPAVWFYQKGRDAWAILHMLTRHAVQLDEIVVLEVSIPRTGLVRSAQAGLWFTRSDVPPDCIRAVRAYVQTELPLERSA